MAIPPLLLVTDQARTVHSGVGTYARVLIAGLSKAGLDPVVATWSEEMDPALFPAASWLDLGPKHRRDPTPGSFLTLGKRIVTKLAESRMSFDVIHFLDARGAYRLVGSELREGKRVLGTVHDDYACLAGWNPFAFFGKASDPIRRWCFYRFLAQLEGRCYPKLDGLMLNSRATGQTVQDRYGLDPELMQLVHLTVATSCAELAGEEARVTLDGNPALLFSGGNFYRKGLDTCVRALALLEEELPQAKLHIAGTDKAENKIRSLARRLGVRERLCFHSRVKAAAMLRMFEAADIFLMPSRTEALGLVYLEAFRCGLPVIAGNIGGVTEIVRDNENGLLVPPQDPYLLAEAILRLHRDPALRQKLRRCGYETLEERSETRLVQETVAVYFPAKADSGTSTASSLASSSGAHEGPAMDSRANSKRLPTAFGENIRS